MISPRKSLDFFAGHQNAPADPLRFKPPQANKTVNSPRAHAKKRGCLLFIEKKYFHLWFPFYRLHSSASFSNIQHLIDF